jgi:hypothetical protein
MVRSFGIYYLILKYILYTTVSLNAAYIIDVITELFISVSVSSSIIKGSTIAAVVGHSQFLTVQ